MITKDIQQIQKEKFFETLSLFVSQPDFSEKGRGLPKLDWTRTHVMLLER